MEISMSKMEAAQFSVSSKFWETSIHISVPPEDGTVAAAKDDPAAPPEDGTTATAEDDAGAAPEDDAGAAPEDDAGA
ncbi:MAG: hypothetical protein AAGJ80_07505, partial [Cyanobacteria bacterium J06553_1]